MNRTELFTTKLPPYSLYVEMCMDNGGEPKPEDSDDYYEWAAEDVRMNMKDFMDTLEHCDIAHETFEITGSLGLWDGTYEIFPVEINSLRTAVQKCINTGDDFEIYLCDGVIEIDSHHHDGTNHFKIKLKSGEIKDLI